MRGSERDLEVFSVEVGLVGLQELDQVFGLMGWLVAFSRDVGLSGLLDVDQLGE